MALLLPSYIIGFKPVDLDKNREEEKKKKINFNGQSSRCFNYECLYINIDDLSEKNLY
jgi:hypothetical protein